MRNRNINIFSWQYESPECLIDNSPIIVLVLLGFIFTTLTIPSTMASSDLLQVTSGHAQFANKLYSILCKEKGNVFFSPLSAHTVLALAYQGAGGDTAKQFASSLNIPNQKVAASGYNSVMTALNSVQNVTLHIANKVFVMKNFPLKTAFTKAASESFLSEAEQVNFAASKEAADNINKWVEKKTNSKIKDLISADCLNALTRLVLVNAVYFKGNWAHQFKKEFTNTQPFYISKSDKVDCQMMHITKRFNYREDEALDAKVLELPYNNENVSMVVVLPNERDGIKKLESKLENVDLSTLTQNMRHVEVEVSLPKFKIETTMDLKDVLIKMGLGVIFDSDKADFSEISESPEQLYVSKVIQKAFIEVNEEGAEAAAATGMMAVAMCLPPPPVQFQINHPFIVLLQARGENTNNILFAGRISQPEY